MTLQNDGKGKRSLTARVLFGAIVLISLVAAAVANGTPGAAGEFTACHANATCDEGRCYAIDHQLLCLRDVRLSDARRTVCFAVAESSACFVTLAECAQFRARQAELGVSAGECGESMLDAGGAR